MESKKNTITLERLFNIPVSKMWAIWTDPKFIELWFGSDFHGTVLSTEINLSVGGRYGIQFRDSDGSLHTAFGKYTGIVPLSELRYTWEWESEPGYVSEVRVEFRRQADKALLILTHYNLNPDSSHVYRDGWNRTLDKVLTRIINPGFI